MARSTPSIWHLSVCVAAAVFVLAGHSAGAEALKPLDQPWDAGNGFFFGKKPKKEVKTRQSVSGIACPAEGGGKRLCLVAFDEGGEARYVVLGDGAYTVESERVVLLEGDREFDAEGAAIAFPSPQRFVYVTGSHSAKRSDCTNNEDSHQVIRFQTDPITGRALRQPAGDPNGALVGLERTSNLWTIMTSLPELKDRVGKCLGAEHGVNIEGLAIKGDRLFFGFREPAQDGFVPVLGVDADALFKGGDAKPRVTSIAVGAGRGIRDLAAVKDGVLILAGPDDSEANKDVHVTISLWDGESSDTGPVTPRSLAELDLRDVKLRECDKELKPEALAVIEDASDHYRVAVLSDGMCDGGPMTFVIPR